MKGLSVLRVPRYVAALLLLLFGIAGYLSARWFSSPTDNTALASICARVDYVNRLQEQMPEQQSGGEEVHEEFKALVEQCRRALRE